MWIIGILICLAGIILSFAAGMMLLHRMFLKSGALWAVASLFVPFVSVIWIVQNWEEGRSPFVKSLVGAGLCIIGSAVTSGLAPS